MSPEAPLFLLAALAAAIPVILHMISRQRAKHVPFSTLRFLRTSVEKTRRRRRIQDLLLMLLRAAALVLIAIGLSEIRVTQLSALLGRGSASAVAIVLDNSASMALADKGRPRFETARGAVNQILQELGPDDQAALWLTGGPPFDEQGHLDTSRDALLRMFNQCSVSNERADLAMRIEEARKALAASTAPNKVIYVITDVPKHGWEGLGTGDGGLGTGDEGSGFRVQGSEPGASSPAPAPRSLAPSPPSPIPIVIVDCAREPEPNVAVQNVALESAVPVAGVPVKATVELFNAAPSPQQRLLELYVDDQKKATSPVIAIPPEAKSTHAFQFSFERGGLHRCEARLVGQDGSPLDDRWFFSMEVDQGIPVAIVTPKRHEIPYLDDSFYVQQALMPARSGNGAIRGTVFEAKDLATEKLQNYAVVYCVNLPAPEADAAEKLRQYVAHGGHVFWICGENVQPDAYNAMNQQAQGQLLPAPLVEVRTATGATGVSPVPASSTGKMSVPPGRDSWHIRYLDEKHRALAPLVKPEPLYQSALIYKYVRVDAKAAAASGASVLARLDEAGPDKAGEPLLVQRKIGRGSVTMLGTSAHVGWTNLPLKTIFLPLLVRMTFDLAGAEQAQRTVLAGSPLVLRLDGEKSPVSVAVVPPSGTLYELKTTSEPGRVPSGRGQVLRYNDTYDVGFYTMRPLVGTGAKQVAFAVNVDPEEANPAKADPEELKERFAPTDVVFAEDPEDLTSTFRLLHEGTKLWDYFLWAVLFVLVFETLVSNWLSPKPADEQLQHVPPGMRRMAMKGQAA
jgi:hypothetical protein